MIGPSLTTLLALSLPADVAASWPQFLGPRRDGQSTEKNLTTDWTRQPPKEDWRISFGAGYSSLVVAGDRLYTQVQKGERDGVVCLEAATGKEHWFVDVAPTYIDRQRQGAGPRATPTLHDGKLYCLFPRGTLVCLQADDGKRLWSVNIFERVKARDPAKDLYYWGLSASPLIEKGLVIVQPGGDKGRSVLALDAATGETVWTTGDEPPGYGSAIAIDAAGRRQIVVPTGTALLGIAPENGQLLWRYRIGNTMFNTNCTTPLWTGDTLFYSSAYGAGAVALELTASGEKITVKERWKVKHFQNQFTTSMIVDDHVYGCHGDIGTSMLKCIDLKTGKERWTDRKPRKCGLLAFDGHLIVASEDGAVRLLKADATKAIWQGELAKPLAPRIWAAPVLADGRLYLRSEKELLRLDLRR